MNSVEDWAIKNRFQLNEKCKELEITFAKHRDDLPPLLVNGQALKVEDKAKLLGLTINSNLT